MERERVGVGVGVGDKVERKKKVKILASKQIIDAVSRIAYASESYAVVTNTPVVPSASIGEVMVEIQNMEVITSDPDWHCRCCQLIMKKDARKYL